MVPKIILKHLQLNIKTKEINYMYFLGWCLKKYVNSTQSHSFTDTVALGEMKVDVVNFKTFFKKLKSLVNKHRWGLCLAKS